MRPAIDATASEGGLMLSDKFFVVVDGGVCQYVGNEKVDLMYGTGQAELIDFDNLEGDPTVFWEGLSKEAREFFKVTYPDDYRKLLADLHVIEKGK